MFVDAASSQFLGASLEGVGPGKRVGRVVAPVDVVVVQERLLVVVGGRSTRVGSGRSHGRLLRRLGGGGGPGGGKARSPAGGNHVVQDITTIVGARGRGRRLRLSGVLSGGRGGLRRRGGSLGGSGSGRHGVQGGSSRGHGDGFRGGRLHLLLFRLTGGGGGKGEEGPFGFKDTLVEVERRTHHTSGADSTEQVRRSHIEF